MTIDKKELARLKEAALAVKGTCDSPARDPEWTKYKYAASPSLILEMLAELEMLNTLKAEEKK